MSELEIANSLERWQYLIFKLVQALIFLGTLCQILNRHFRIAEFLAKWATLFTERFAGGSKSLSAKRPEVMG